MAMDGVGWEFTTNFGVSTVRGLLGFGAKMRQGGWAVAHATSDRSHEVSQGQVSMVIVKYDERNEVQGQEEEISSNVLH